MSLNMIFNCSICCEVISSDSDLYGTPCGHIFHYPCLLHWLERSKTCPQCRKPVTQAKLVKLFLNIVECNSFKEDPSELIKTSDDLKLQLLTKNKKLNETEGALKEITSSFENIKKEKDGLANYIKILESQCSALRKHMKNQTILENDLKILTKENDYLEAQIKTLKGMHTVVHGSSAEAVEVIQNMCDGSEASRSMATYCAALKSAMISMEQKLSNQKKEMDSLKKALLKSSNVEESLKQSKLDNLVLDSHLSSAENEIKGLKKKLALLESALLSPTPGNKKDSALSRLIHESPMPEELRHRPAKISRADENTISEFKDGKMTPVKVPNRNPFKLKPAADFESFSLLKALETNERKEVKPEFWKSDQSTICYKGGCCLATNAKAKVPMLPSKCSGCCSSGVKISNMKQNAALGKPCSSNQLLKSCLNPHPLANSRLARMATSTSQQKSSLLSNFSAPPEGMVYNGLGGTVKADHPITPRTIKNKFKLKNNFFSQP